MNPLLYNSLFSTHTNENEEKYSNYKTFTLFLLRATIVIEAVWLLGLSLLI